MRNESEHELPLGLGTDPDIPDTQEAENTGAESESRGIPTLSVFVPESIPDSQEFYIPVHGFVWLTADEVAVVDHPAFQRLAEMYQLGHAYLLFRGATHKRFEHAIGSVFVAQRIVDALQQNHARNYTGTIAQAQVLVGNTLSKQEVIFTRLAALLHDIGHIPLGHTLEDELCILPKHDSISRLRAVFRRKEWHGLEFEPMSDLLNRLYAKYLPPNSVSPSELVIHLICCDEEASSSLAAGLIRMRICRAIVGNTVCADLLDYLHRDWHHLGFHVTREYRIFQYFEIRRAAADKEEEFVVSIKGKKQLRSDAISAILELLESRYKLAESVLYHRTKCSAVSCLDRGILEIHASLKDEAEREAWLRELLDRFLESSDATAIQFLRDEARRLTVAAAELPLRSLARRSVYKALSCQFLHNTGASNQTHILDRYGGQNDKQRKQKQDAIHVLEDDFQLDRGSITLYCPSRDMKFKVAHVKICDDVSIRTFAQWDEEERTHSGGHLAAQRLRYDHLWRVYVFLERSTYGKLSTGVLGELKSAAEKLMLGILGEDENLAVAAVNIAKRLSEIKNSPYYGEEIRPEVPVGHRQQSIVGYPTGAPSLRSLVSSTNDT